jgi:short-subunit dehydrogenase
VRDRPWQAGPMDRLRFKDRWVLVTGASAGLGREFSRRLAYDHGANLVVVARRSDRLEDLKRELESRAGVVVRSVVGDPSKLDDVDAIAAQGLAGIDLYAAILNAGVTHFGAHESLSWPQFESMLHTNVTSVVRLTNHLLPRLEAYPGGALMLVSSMAGLLPVPYQTAYSATKAFVVHFGAGLTQELRGRPVSITTYAPGGIATEMTAGQAFRPLRKWLVPVEAAARDGIEAMQARKALHVPGWSNRLGVALANLLPGDVVARRLAATYRRALEASGQIPHPSANRVSAQKE